MNIPVVQGTAVPDNDNYGKSSQPYQAVDDNQYANNDGNVMGGGDFPQPQQHGYRDVFWGALFWFHLIAMVSLMVVNVTGGGDGGGGGGAGEFKGIIFMVCVLAAAAVGIATAALSFMMRFAKELVKISLIVTVILSLAISILGFISGQIFMGVMGLLSFAFGICYAKMVWPRIPFAAANLNTALTAVRANMGLTLVAYFVLALAFGWSILWFVGFGGAISTSNGGIVFLLLVSYYWVHQVLTNTVHVTSAGTVGTWWFVPAEASSCCSQAVQDSVCRATTYSFGSIALGSLIVAVVQALRAMAHMARQNDDMQMLACIIECILACVQDIIEYLNHWAYVYVGLYGFGFVDAGRNVWQLFENKGWTVIINDDLCDRVLFLVNLCIGLVTGLLGLVLAAADQDLLAALNLEDGQGTVAFFIGLIVGFVFSSILMSIVDSSVATVIVCYAESPAEFQANHPRLSEEMRQAWTTSWPGLF